MAEGVRMAAGRPEAVYEADNMRMFSGVRAEQQQDDGPAEGSASGRKSRQLCEAQRRFRGYDAMPDAF